MLHNLTNGVKTARCVNATVAGTTAINGTGVDTLGYDAVRFICLMGALTATQITSLSFQESTDNSTWGASISTTAAAADADSNKTLILDIYRPRQRYVRPVVNRGTANAVIDGVIAELYRAGATAVTADTSVSQQLITLPTT